MRSSSFLTVQMECKIGTTTVIMKPIPRTNARSLRRFLSITTFPEYLIEEVNNSDVINTMMVVTPSHRLMSDMERGKCIFSQAFIMRYKALDVLLFGPNAHVLMMNARAFSRCLNHRLWDKSELVTN
jgi:hypothetical protein